MISTFNHERSCRLTCFCFFNAFFRLSNQLNTPKFDHSHPSFDYDSFCMPLSKTRAERMYCLPMTSLQPTAQSQQWMNKGGDSAVSAKRQLPLISFVAFLISFEFRGRHWSDDGHVVWLIALHFSFSLPCCAHSFGFFLNPHFAGRERKRRRRRRRKKCGHWKLCRSFFTPTWIRSNGFACPIITKRDVPQTLANPYSDITSQDFYANFAVWMSCLHERDWFLFGFWKARFRD